MAWIALIVAGLLEICWAYYMKQSQGFTLMTPSVIAIATSLASFVLLAVAMKSAANALQAKRTAIARLSEVRLVDCMVAMQELF